MDQRHTRTHCQIIPGPYSMQCLLFSPHTHHIRIQTLHHVVAIKYWHQERKKGTESTGKKQHNNKEKSIISIEVIKGVNLVFALLYFFVLSFYFRVYFVYNFVFLIFHHFHYFDFNTRRTCK